MEIGYKVTYRDEITPVSPYEFTRKARFPVTPKLCIDGREYHRRWRRRTKRKSKR